MTASSMHRLRLALAARRPIVAWGGVVTCIAVASAAWRGADPERRDVRRALGDARHFADSVERAASEHTPSADGAVVLGYLSRQREGLGSPMRLVDLARLDPRLPEAWRERTAWALLARTAEQDAVPPAAPGALALAVAADSLATRAGAALADVIARTVADDPGAESLEALRIAALVAGAEGTLRPRAVPLVGATAVLVRDRLRARRDARRVLDAAARGDGDALALVARWRVARAFASERPTLADPPPDAPRLARRVPALVRRLDAVVRAPASTQPSVTPAIATPPALAVATVQPLAAGPRQLRLDAPATSARPPQPQVRLPLQDALALTRALAGDAWRPRAAALVGAVEEEGFAAALPRARADTLVRRAADVATLLVAQGLRPLAQEAPWHPGRPLPAPDAVAASLGLASLRFGADVPAAWRPWYARQLELAVASLRTVFPRADVRGLHVRIGARLPADALALHDPHTRTLVLPTATGAGAIGHELLHDIDWQAARDVLRRTGSYATDAAVRGRRPVRGPLAAPLVRLSALAAPADARATDPRAREARRPAELLARGGDWYLAQALARAGRSDGALTSVQDAWTPGYASATRPDPFGAHEAALAALLDAMPRLAVRAPARPDVPATADLGALARLAWLVPLPRGPVSPEGGWPTPRALAEAPGTAIMRARGAPPPACSPSQRARWLPVQVEGRAIVDAVLAPRVRAALERWAAAPAPADEAPAATFLRLALAGAPVDGAVVRAAEAAWLAEARRRLPCVADDP